MSKRFPVAASAALAVLMPCTALALSTEKLVPDRILTTAKAHLTPRGATWAKGEAQRLRTGEIGPNQVEKDAALVTDGLVSDAVPDELVLIALIDARNAESGPSHVNKTKLDQSISNVMQTLTDTQRPSDQPLKH
jgi:hypothetical protein